MDRKKEPRGAPLGAQVDESRDQDRDTEPKQEQPDAEELDEARRSGFGEDSPSGRPDLQAPTFISRFGSPALAAIEEPEQPEDDGILPRAPRTLSDLGLSKAFLADLTLKILHYSGTPTASQLTRRLGLSIPIMQQLVSALTEERLIEVLSQSDLYTGNYRYRLSEKGHQRASEALERSRYAGPAPVTAEQYSEGVRKLHAHEQDPGRGRIKAVVNELVLHSEVADALARALFSGKVAILYGPSGNGKTVVLEQYAKNTAGFFLVPYAIYAYGQVIRVFDQSVHEPIDDPEAGTEKEDTKMDRRWVRVRRPAIVVGAEMSHESLDMAHDPQAGFYQAPPHIKAQGGVLVVDDFGRQKIAPRDLLTRWLIPLERGWDTLSLVTGEKLTVPFQIQLLLGTNLPIKKLADDALLRRVLYKVQMPNPGPEEFKEILRRTCLEKRVFVADDVLDHVTERLYDHPDLRPRGSYARDILNMLIESASYDAQDPVLDRPSFDRVFRLFVSQETENGDDGAD